MQYTNLDSALPSETEQINFYGLIIDAGHPYKGTNRYICTLKVIDLTLHSTEENAENKGKFGLVTYYAKRMEDLPVVRKIGDIVRVHTAIVKDYKGIKQFNVNLAYSSWCLFHSADILFRDKGIHTTAEQEAALADQDSSSDNDEEMEGDEKKIEKSERRKYTPYKFSGKSYNFDYT